ncbi:MAG: FGGY-family carbohydrate kinase [Acidimicrobiaceae bacterium]|nr:FGGY-family carbohydrate kinase [Acidimicrobiaceae bacterium]
MSSSANVLAVDLGTSRVKVGVFDARMRTLASAASSYATLSDASGMAEQRPSDWLQAINAAILQVLEGGSFDIAAVVLSAQMPTLVALDSDSEVIGNAITWQDSRADALVDSLLDSSARQLVRAIAGTPVDGRYIVPMHRRRADEAAYSPAALLSAKDFIYFALTGELVTDPSTASGFACFDIETGTWSARLCELWGVPERMLPAVVDSHFSAELTSAGALLVPGVAPGTPVVVGAADSVCAHHFVDSHFANAVSVIDGSSTVIMTRLESDARSSDEMLVTPLVEWSQRGVEMDLLATGSSVAWLARLLELNPAELEDLAHTNPNGAHNEVLFFPYLAGGEQGAIWRTDLSGSVDGLHLASSRADLALALYEGIAFETLRCIEHLAQFQPVQRIVSVASAQSRYLGASLLGALCGVPVLALERQSPSLQGAAIIALECLGGADARDMPNEPTALGELPELDDHYREFLVRKARRYLDSAPHASN